MARTSVLRKDPWQKLCRRKGNQQVCLDQVLSGLEVKGGKAHSLKKAMLDRVRHVAREN